MENPDIGSFQGLRKDCQFLMLVCGCDQKEFKRLASENALERFSQFFKVVMNRGDYDGDILRIDRRAGGYGD
jgi:hypothetical protein